MITLHKDPTFERAARLELREKQCRACLRRVVLSCGRVMCSKGKRWPRCMGQKDGFVEDMGDAA